MNRTGKPIVDNRGKAMFACSLCGVAMTDDDFFDQGLRLPDAGESLDEYCDAELTDVFRHLACVRSVAAS